MVFHVSDFSGQNHIPCLSVRIILEFGGGEDYCRRFQVNYEVFGWTAEKMYKKLVFYTYF